MSSIPTISVLGAKLPVQGLIPLRLRGQGKLALIIQAKRQSSLDLPERLYNLADSKGLPVLVTTLGDVHVFVDCPGVNDENLPEKIQTAKEELEKVLAE